MWTYTTDADFISQNNPLSLRIPRNTFKYEINTKTQTKYKNTMTGVMGSLIPYFF
jgi:hypothetical protein